MSAHSLCLVCNRAIHKINTALKCDNCKNWIHYKCNKHAPKGRDNHLGFCIFCIKLAIPFSNISDTELINVFKNDKLNDNSSSKKRISQHKPKHKWNYFSYCDIDELQNVSNLHNVEKMTSF